VATKVVSAQDGFKLTVNAMVKDPTLIPARLVSDLQQEFITDAVLRRLPPTNSGIYEYTDSTPLFADGSAAVVEEFGEIPVITGRIGDRKAAYTVKRALAMMVSQEMVNRNDVDRVNTLIKQIRNTMVRSWETTFLTAVFTLATNTQAAVGTWSGVSSKIRTDLALGGKKIRDAAPTTDPDNYFGFTADTLIIGHQSQTDLMTNADFNAAFASQGPLATKNTGYTGELPGTFFGYNIMVSRELDRLYPGKALLLERKTIGGIGDERPLRATELYADRPRETWRSDLVRQSAVVIDQPGAACIITGV
jgi:hypothetical protein